MVACRKHPEERAVPLERDASTASSATPSPSSAPSIAPSTTVAVPSASVEAPAPAGSVKLAEPPDVRVTLPESPKIATVKSVVKVDQTFGILLPDAGWPDEWEVQSCKMDEKEVCPLGTPLTIITREGGIGREVMWKIDREKIGTRKVFVRLMHRTMRTDPGTPTRRVAVVVEIVPSQPSP